jgi:twitching motility protein PilT
MNKQAITQVFTRAVELKASDVHLGVGSPILFRIDGVLTPQTQSILGPQEAEELIAAALEPATYTRLQQQREVDASFTLPTGERVRINCLYERGHLSLVGRIITNEIPGLQELMLEEISSHFATIREGLVLFTGPTGSGKSTSLASIIQNILNTRPVNTITLEDPIEYLFQPGAGVIRQRQFGEDFVSFPDALKHVLRQDPNVVLVGEMRDPETISAALTLAETGHLIFATLHTPNTTQTVDRIIDVFPPYQQPQVRSQLSMSLKAVVAQRLVPKVGGGRVAVREMLLNNPAVANIIRDNRTPELKSVLQTQEAMGMMTFDKHTRRLYKEGLLDKETAEWVLATI